MVSQEKIEVDDYVRWLGRQKPVGLAWIGLAILEVAAALFILSRAYIEFDTYLSKQETNQIHEIVNTLRDLERQ